MARLGRAYVGFAVGLLAAHAAVAGIRFSHHDFSNGPWADGEICKPCHTPHDADATIADAPLWNHELTSATYVLYDSDTLNATPGQPGGISKLCLSCHDATVAIDSFGGQTGTRTIGATFEIGTDLSSHHPISITYDSSLATQDGELFDPAGTSTVLGGTIQTDLLFGDRLECSSCHDVHVQRNDAGCIGCHDPHGSPDPPTLSLRIDNTGSGLCLTCHDK